MLTNEDIKKIIQANMEVFPSKQDFEGFKEEMKKDFSDLQTVVEYFANKKDVKEQEDLMLSNKVNRQERWIKQVAEKLNIKLEY